MGDQVKTLRAGEDLSVEVVGDLITDGWLPGTWVTYSTQIPVANVITSVDISDGTGVLAGFLLIGPQHRQPVEELSDMWTTDQRQRDGGDTQKDWGATDAGGDFNFDNNGLVQKVGTRVATMIVPPTGFHKFYVFETEDLAERTTPGSGADLVYTVGDLLYVSNRGRLTSEQESGSHTWTGYITAQASSDYEGDFVIAVAGMV